MTIADILKQAIVPLNVEERAPRVTIHMKHGHVFEHLIVRAVDVDEDTVLYRHPGWYQSIGVTLSDISTVEIGIDIHG